MTTTSIKGDRHLRAIAVVAITTTVVVVVTVIALVWPRQDTFNGTVANIRESRAWLCIHPDDNGEARCGMPYAALNANIDSGVRVTVRVMHDMTIPADGPHGTTSGDWLVLTPR